MRLIPVQCLLEHWIITDIIQKLHYFTEPKYSWVTKSHQWTQPWTTSIHCNIIIPLPLLRNHRWSFLTALQPKYCMHLIPAPPTASWLTQWPLKLTCSNYWTGLILTYHSASCNLSIIRIGYRQWIGWFISLHHVCVCICLCNAQPFYRV